MSGSLVSVIIPTYNRAGLIARAIKSVLNQTYQHYEIIVVDDNSIDSTQRVVQNYNDKRIRYIKHNSNKGGGAARNTGIENASGKFISFLDSDDKWKKNMLLEHINSYLRDNKSRIQFTQLFVEGGDKIRILPQSIYQPGENLSEYIFCRYGLVSTITMFMPSIIAYKIKFDETLKKHQDYDFVLRAYKKGIKFHMVKKPLAIWFREDRKDRIGQGVDFNSSLDWLENRKNLFTKKSAQAFIRRDVLGQVIRGHSILSSINIVVGFYKKKLIPWEALFFCILKILILKINIIFHRKF